MDSTTPCNGLLAPRALRAARTDRARTAIPDLECLIAERGEADLRNVPQRRPPRRRQRVGSSISGALPLGRPPAPAQNTGGFRRSCSCAAPAAGVPVSCVPGTRQSLGALCACLPCRGPSGPVCAAGHAATRRRAWCPSATVRRAMPDAVPWRSASHPSGCRRKGTAAVNTGTLTPHLRHLSSQRSATCAAAACQLAATAGRPGWYPACPRRPAPRRCHGGGAASLGRGPDRPSGDRPRRAGVVFIRLVAH